MIEVSNLTKRYGAKQALSDVSFSVGEGEILGFLGPNGAGKSTAMNIVTGYLSSTAGTVKVGGYDILEQPARAKALMGYLPEQPPLYLDMTVWEYLSFVFRLKSAGKAGHRRKAHIWDICERVGVADMLDRGLGNLSKGYRQRVGLAQALVGDPPVLILDEPTVGLDPKQIIEIRDLIRELGKQHTVVLSSHILPEVQAVCPRVLVINEGVLIADDTPEGLSRSIAGENRLLARIAGPRERVGDLLRGLSGVVEVNPGPAEEDAANWDILLEEGADVRKPLFFALARKGWPLLSLRGSEMSLEEIFLALTARAEAAARESALVEESAEDAENHTEHEEEGEAL